MIKMRISILVLSFITFAGFGANWGEILQKSIFFFEAQQAGPLMPGNRVEWRANATMRDAVLGGWYDAGDHVKFNLPMAYSAMMLGWAEYEYKSAFTGSGQLTYIENNTKFALDYLANCWNGTAYTYQIGDGGADHSWWGPVEVLENKSSAVSLRPAATVTAAASCVMAETAAALALGYLNYGDANYLTKAKSLFAKADADKSDANYTKANGFYDSWSGFYDELILSAYWLYKATGDSSYLTKAVSYIPNLNKQGQTTDIEYMYGNSWDDVHYAALLLIARENGNADALKCIENNLDWWVAGANGKTPNGLSWLQSWGSLRYAATTAFLAFVYADWSGANATKASAYKTWATSQLNYIAGSNERNSSYIVGYGTNPPLHPHHRTAHGSWSDQQTMPTNHRHTIYGGLVGGPTQTGSFMDDIGQYQYTEVACDYNAALVASAAKMYNLFGGSPATGFPPAETKEDEFFVEASLNSTGPNYTEIKALCNNRSGWPARAVSNLAFNYFIDISEVIAAGGSASSLTVKTNYVEFPITVTGPTQWSGNIYYFHIQFNDGTKIFPGGQSDFAGEVQFRISCPDGTTYWNPANDPSYSGLVSGTAAKTQFIPVYSGTTKIFGTEPNGNGATAIPTTVPTAIPTAAPTPTPDPLATEVPTAVPTVAPTAIPTAVPTVVPTAIPTAAPTAVPTAVPTPATECTCRTGCSSTTAITAPFTKDGSGEFCFTASSLGAYINSWNLDVLEVNGVNLTNLYTSALNLPAKINNLYYVYYKASFAWSHFEAK